jgi:hypothetical protein
MDTMELAAWQRQRQPDDLPDYDWRPPARARPTAPARGL